MEKNPPNKSKRVFWQALIMAFVIFWTGIMLGIFFEDSRANKLEIVFFNAETDIFDVQLQNEILELLEFNCETAIQENINFADKIYFDARQLEKYDASTKITQDIIDLHKRYDLLRVMLWKNTIKLQEKCQEEINSVVYLYDYNEPSVNTKAKQGALSNSLLELKSKYQDIIILIPIADDTGVKSLDLLKQTYNLQKYKPPIVVINQKHIITNIQSVEELEQYINQNKIKNKSPIILN